MDFWSIILISLTRLERFTRNSKTLKSLAKPVFSGVEVADHIFAIREAKQLRSCSALWQKKNTSWPCMLQLSESHHDVFILHYQRWVATSKQWSDTQELFVGCSYCSFHLFGSRSISDFIDWHMLRNCMCFLGNGGCPRCWCLAWVRTVCGGFVGFQ
jgi:hypothetical protein